MKRNITLKLLLPLLLLSGIATGQAERTFVKSFNLQGKQTVVLDIGDNYQVTMWDSEIMRVQMTVSLPNSSDALLKSLAEIGRYGLTSTINPETLNFTAPILRNPLKINGNPVTETVFYTVFVPKNVTILKTSDPKIVNKLVP
ncbi:MAG: hypothetical protein U5L45_07895 [Saprospiraceae bacterium]|nr:hypothetical protein [Saprospiraceae bacterium]